MIVSALLQPCYVNLKYKWKARSILITKVPGEPSPTHMQISMYAYLISMCVTLAKMAGNSLKF